MVKTQFKTFELDVCDDVTDFSASTVGFPEFLQPQPDVVHAFDRALSHSRWNVRRGYLGEDLEKNHPVAEVLKGGEDEGAL